MGDDTAVRFREVRPYRRGTASLRYAAIGGVAMAVAALASALPARPLIAAAGALLMVPLVLSFETTVAAGTLSLVVRPVWRKRIDLRQVERVELTVADNQVEVFGGWNARENVVTALASTAEGDRSVGNRAVVLTMRSGRVHQVGSFRAGQLLAAIEAERAAAG